MRVPYGLVHTRPGKYLYVIRFVSCYIQQIFGGDIVEYAHHLQAGSRCTHMCIY